MIKFISSFKFMRAKKSECTWKPQQQNVHIFVSQPQPLVESQDPVFGVLGNGDRAPADSAAMHPCESSVVCGDNLT